jgi:hypothetical protein
MSSEAVDKPTKIVATIGDLTWDCHGERIAPDPRQPSKDFVVGISMTNSPRKPPIISTNHFRVRHDQSV